MASIMQCLKKHMPRGTECPCWSASFISHLFMESRFVVCRVKSFLFRFLCYWVCLLSAWRLFSSLAAFIYQLSGSKHLYWRLRTDVTFFRYRFRSILPFASILSFLCIFMIHHAIRFSHPSFSKLMNIGTIHFSNYSSHLPMLAFLSTSLPHTEYTTDFSSILKIVRYIDTHIQDMKKEVKKSPYKKYRKVKTLST